MARIVTLYELNFAIWCFAAIPSSQRNGFNILLDLVGIAVGAAIGFFGISWRLKPLASRGELRTSRKDFVASAILIILWVYLIIYPGPLAILTALSGVSSMMWAALAALWGGYVFAVLRWEKIHGMDIESEGNWGRILRAVPKHKQILKQ